VPWVAATSCTEHVNHSTYYLSPLPLPPPPSPSLPPLPFLPLPFPYPPLSPSPPSFLPPPLSFPPFPLPQLPTSQVNTGARLLRDVRNDLADVVQVCAAKKKQTNYLRNLTSDLAKGNRGLICNDFCSYNIIFIVPSLTSVHHSLPPYLRDFFLCTHTCQCTLYAHNTQNTPTMHIHIHNHTHTHIHFVLHLHTLILHSHALHSHTQHLHTQYTQVSFPAVGVDTRYLQV